MIQLVYVVFAFCGIVLGDVINFFDRFKYWDAILHFISGVLLASLGFILINTLNKADSVSLRISPIYVAVSVFCFAVTGGVIWEIVEYCFDDLFGTNMQTYLDSTTGSLVDENAVYLVGHEALKDTMWDLMLDAAGGLIVAVYGFIELKHEKKMTTAAFEFEGTRKALPRRRKPKLRPRSTPRNKTVRTVHATYENTVEKEGIGYGAEKRNHHHRARPSAARMGEDAMAQVKAFELWSSGNRGRGRSPPCSPNTRRTRACTPRVCWKC